MPFSFSLRLEKGHPLFVHLRTLLAVRRPSGLTGAAGAARLRADLRERPVAIPTGMIRMLRSERISAWSAWN